MDRAINKSSLFCYLREVPFHPISSLDVLAIDLPILKPFCVVLFRIVLR